MGADMLLAMAPAPIDESGAAVVEADRLCERIHERALKCGVESQLELDDYEDILDLPDDADAHAAAAAIVGALEPWLRSGGMHHRDVAWIRIGERDWIASGGLSWGDAPTDSYSYITLLDAIEAFEAPFKGS